MFVYALIFTILVIVVVVTHMMRSSSVTTTTTTDLDLPEEEEDLPEEEEDLEEDFEGRVPPLVLKDEEKAALEYVRECVGVKPRVTVWRSLRGAQGRYHHATRSIRLARDRHPHTLVHELVHWLHHGRDATPRLKALCREALGTSGEWVDHSVPYMERPQEVVAFGLEETLHNMALGREVEDEDKREVVEHLLYLKPPLPL